MPRDSLLLGYPARSVQFDAVPLPIPEAQGVRDVAVRAGDREHCSRIQPSAQQHHRWFGYGHIYLLSVTSLSGHASTASDRPRLSLQLLGDLAIHRITVMCIQPRTASRQLAARRAMGVASGIRCKSAGMVPGFVIRLGDGADSFGPADGGAGGDGVWPQRAGGSGRERRRSGMRRSPSLVMTRPRQPAEAGRRSAYTRVRQLVSSRSPPMTLVRWQVSARPTVDSTTGDCRRVEAWLPLVLPHSKLERFRSAVSPRVMPTVAEPVNLMPSLLRRNIGEQCA